MKINFLTSYFDQISTVIMTWNKRFAHVTLYIIRRSSLNASSMDQQTTIKWSVVKASLFAPFINVLNGCSL